MVSGYAWRGGSGWFQRHWQRLTAPMISRALRWASILGNHCAEGELNRANIIDLDARTGGGLSLTQRGPSNITGAGSYYLDIYDSQGQGIVKARLWMLDTMAHGCGPVMDGWGCVAAYTLQWFRQTAARLPRVPSAAFLHIPVPQFMELFNTNPTWGDKGEAVGCPLAETGVFQALREAGVSAIYSGHDHDSDFYGVLQGVRLAYGRKSGYGGYGPRGRQHGARVIILREGEDPATSATWIRQEDGSREDQLPTPPLAKASGHQDTCDGRMAATLSAALASVPRRGDPRLRAPVAGALLLSWLAAAAPHT